MATINELYGLARKHWNVFVNNRDPTFQLGAGYGSASRPDRYRPSRRGQERTIVNAIIGRIAMDVASIDIMHIRTDDQGRYASDIDSYLNECFTVEANIDQSAYAFRIDMAISMMSEGVIAVVPVDTDSSIMDGRPFDIETMRVAKITQWYPAHVEVDIYDDHTGLHKRRIVPKRSVAILENPLYSVMNEPNSILQRLIRKLSILDAIDEQSGSGKLDLIIQLPYVVKGDIKRAEAEKRRKDIEHQLADSKYGIAYIDGTERVTQLNRGVENNLMNQIQFLTDMVYSQIGISMAILNGTADENEMTNYFARAIEPMVKVMVSEFRRKWLSKTARSQHQDIRYFRDPFKLIPANKIADYGDKLIRNQILSSNEMREALGRKPSDDPNADKLQNPNISQPKDQAAPTEPTEESTATQEEIQNE